MPSTDRCSTRGAAPVSGPNLEITYSVPSTVDNSVYPLRIEFFLADGDNEEGQTYLGADTYASANATLPKVAILPAGGALIGSRIVATATDDNGNTSEFSADIGVTS